MIRIQPVILAGGTGSRLWPLSREMFPKQLLRLTEDCSLLQTTLLRAAGLPNSLPPVVVVGEEHRFVTLSQIEELEVIADYTVLLEAEGRDTAPAICGAVEFCSRRVREENVVVLVMPADHVVRDGEKFRQAVEAAAELAMEGLLVTFGIVPTCPETGYGYIEMGQGHAVTSFTEKPDQSVAQGYLASGRHYWNSGMLVFSPESFRKEMEIHGARILACMEKAVQQGEADGCFFRFNAAAMRQCPRNSIDYVLMEKTGRAAMVVADFGWTDVGSWQAVWQILDKDAAGNVCRGDVMAEDTRDSLIHSESVLVAAVGLVDMLVARRLMPCLSARSPSHRM